MSFLEIKGLKKLVDEIAVGRVDLHHFKAGGFGAPGRLAEGFDDVVDLVDGQRLGNGDLTVAFVHQRPGIGRSGLHGRAQKALAAAVLDLDTGHGTGILDRVGQPAQTHNELIVADAQLIGCGFAVKAVDVGILHDDHTHLAPGQVFIIAHQPLGNGAVHMAQARCLRRFADAVFDHDISDLPRREQMRKLFMHQFHTPFL